MNQQTPTMPSAIRAVIFLTSPCQADVPARNSEPACTMAFGAATFVERVMDSCAQAGLRELDLVVSEAPETLRRLLGNGERWGLTLRWHLIKDAATPYGVLRNIGLQSAQRVLIGHGHFWVPDTVLSQLIEANRVAVRVEKTVAWAGWFSLDPLFLHALSPYEDQATVAEVAMSLNARDCVMVHKREFAVAGSAAQLVQAQDLALRDGTGRHVPASWIRAPWGAMSPDAVVHPRARILGPALIGPRCMVAAGAELGPRAVLSRDVLVANGAVVRDSLVLPDTYVGGGLTLDRTIAGGNLVQHLKWAVRLRMPTGDALLAPLREVRSRGAGWAARGLALALAVLASPLAALLWLTLWLGGHAGGWYRAECVVGRDSESAELRTRTLRLPRDGRGARPLLGLFGGLLDVAQGQRTWFGLRPRDASQWYALGRHWQELFSRVPVGLLHAPAWSEGQRSADLEASAAADAFFAARPGPAERARIVAAMLGRALPDWLGSTRRLTGV